MAEESYWSRGPAEPLDFVGGSLCACMARPQSAGIRVRSRRHIFIILIDRSMWKLFLKFQRIPHGFVKTDPGGSVVFITEILDSKVNNRFQRCIWSMATDSKEC